MAEELIVEQAAKEVIEEVAETTNTGTGKVALVLGGALIGFTAGYFFAKKQLEAKYNKLAEDEIAEMRAHYLAKERAAEEKKPLDKVMEEHGYTAKLQGPEETIYVKIEPEGDGDTSEGVEEAAETPQSTNIFEEQEHQDHWDYSIEEATRRDDVPYVIHKDEFFNEETGYEQMTLTYFEGDDVLAGENNSPVDDPDALICLGNLSKFGHGSGDPNVVYVRNVELELEMEIVHSDGLYSEEIHGIPNDDELRHSDRRRRRRRDEH